MPPLAPCDACPKPSITWLRYSGQHLCAAHLQESVERRVKKELKKQGGLPPGRIGVAYSGGKDSTTVLRLLHDVAGDRPDVEIVALTVDEGIAGYRPVALEVATKVTAQLGIRHEVRRVKDFAGVTMDEVHALDSDLGQCSFCGVFRRRLMNDFANEVGAARLVTGHNLDDTAQTILMNLCSADLEKLAKLGPHDVTKPGLVPRLTPLRVIPETEVYLYALTKGFTWHDEECPYSVNAQRAVYRDVLYKLEEARPGTRHALLRTFEELKPLLPDALARDGMRECVRCGEPSSGTLCKACQFRERIAAATA
ncbi:MAG: TIGR00269 family protein [Euryarchaeota archaeon]|nr:TIGR00269 family protein [Euryarchaeota archaeon]